MSEVTRRAFLGTGPGAAAAGLALAGRTSRAPRPAGSGPARPSRRPTTSTAAGPGSRAYVVHVRDASTGEVSVMTGESEVRLHDPALVARVVAAARV